MQPHFFDAHTHAHFKAFENDYKETIERALRTGVWMVNVGTQRDTSASAIQIANEFKEGVYAAVGLHPVHTSESFHDADELGGGEAAKSFTSRGEIIDVDYYVNLARDKRVVAIGECGLDYYRLVTSEGEQVTRDKQKDAFIKQIEIAHITQKPLMIHCRDAFSDLIEILASKSSLLVSEPGIVHFFSGTTDDAKKLLDMGFSFTFGGAITFPPKKGKEKGEYDEVIKLLPLDRILSETDAPYVAPVPYRGKRNEPVFVVEVVKRIAELKRVPVDQMAQFTVLNARRIFRV